MNNNAKAIRNKYHAFANTLLLCFIASAQSRMIQISRVSKHPTYIITYIIAINPFLISLSSDLTQGLIFLLYGFSPLLHPGPRPRMICILKNISHQCKLCVPRNSFRGTFLMHSIQSASGRSRLCRDAITYTGTYFFIFMPEWLAPAFPFNLLKCYLIFREGPFSIPS